MLNKEPVRDALGEVARTYREGRKADSWGLEPLRRDAWVAHLVAITRALEDGYMGHQIDAVRR